MIVTKGYGSRGGIVTKGYGVLLGIIEALILGASEIYDRLRKLVKPTKGIDLMPLDFSAPRFTLRIPYTVCVEFIRKKISIEVDGVVQQTIKPSVTVSTRFTKKT